MPTSTVSMTMHRKRIPMTDLSIVLDRCESLLERVEAMLPPAPVRHAWQDAIAYRWRKGLQRGYLEPVLHPHRLRLRDLQRIEWQKAELTRNTRQFLAGLPANNALLWGARGTGKSSLIRALINAYSDEGLRLIEVDKADLMHLYDVVAPLFERPEKFLLYCDDLSFEAHDPSYKALKAVLDGSICAVPDNVLVYATSNRRHLLPEYLSENREARIVEGELHHGEAVEEKISLSERFGLWLPFHPFSLEDYLEIVAYWLTQFNAGAGMDEEVRQAALRWALMRGSRSGRVAWQFARDYVGRHGID